MARRGRPPGGDSAKTRERIIDSARQAFSERGFAGTAISALAASADLAPSAVYHYFGGKDELYECVFNVTADAVWSSVGSVADEHNNFRASMVALIEGSRSIGTTYPHHNNFLALVPMEARLHPQFAHLLDRRAKYQDAAFGALVDLGLATGELRGIDRSVALEAVRSLIMGWFFERHISGGERPGSAEAVITTIDALIGSVEPQVQ